MDDTARSPGRNARHPALSELLIRIATDESRDRVSVADLLACAGNRAFGPLLFVFALPNAIPTPPGTSAALGLPLVILAGQFLYGRKTPWLPRIITERSIARSDFAALLHRISPTLRRTESVLRPRLPMLVSRLARRLLGLLVLLLAIILFLPIPFGNMLPAIAICVIALSLIEHDGLFVALGASLGVLSVLFVWGALLTLLRVALAAIDHVAVFGA